MRSSLARLTLHRLASIGQRKVTFKAKVQDLECQNFTQTRNKQQSVSTSWFVTIINCAITLSRKSFKEELILPNQRHRPFWVRLHRVKLTAVSYLALNLALMTTKRPRPMWKRCHKHCLKLKGWREINWIKKAASKTKNNQWQVSKIATSVLVLLYQLSTEAVLSIQVLKLPEALAWKRLACTRGRPQFSLDTTLIQLQKNITLYLEGKESVAPTLLSNSTSILQVFTSHDLRLTGMLLVWKNMLIAFQLLMWVIHRTQTGSKTSTGHLVFTLCLKTCLPSIWTNTHHENNFNDLPSQTVMLSILMLKWSKKRWCTQDQAAVSECKTVLVELCTEAITKNLKTPLSLSITLKPSMLLKSWLMEGRRVPSLPSCKPLLLETNFFIDRQMLCTTLAWRTPGIRDN